MDIHSDFLEKLDLLQSFSSIEKEFGRFLCRLARIAKGVPTGDSTAQPDDALWRFLGYLLMRYVADGHSCVDIQHWRQGLLEQLAAGEATDKFSADDVVLLRDETKKLSVSSWHDALRRLQREYPMIVATRVEQGTPLVFHNDANGRSLLYLNKYWQYELDVAAWMRQAAAEQTGCEPSLAEVRQVSTYFSAGSDSSDCQQLAVQKAVGRRFAIITGGPGTGKTTVLSAILALICRDYPQWRLALAAPTGKAKARMQEAITAGVEKLGDVVSDEIKKKLLGLQASTVHSLIGLRPDKVKPIFHAGKRLPYDMVVVDEASMLSLPNMAQLLRALKPDARLLLLGDKDQLSSVETGSVLADLCRCETLRNAIAVLDKNYRAANNRALTDCAQRVVATKDSAAIVQLAEDFYSMRADESQPGAEFKVSVSPEVGKLADALTVVLKEWGLDGWKHAKTLDECFKYVDSFKVLASNREGPFGVVNLNKIMPEILGIKPLADGTPLMILENNKLTGLNNGDIGVVRKNQVHFPNPEWDGRETANKYRVFALGGLPAYELVYAMTIHKSQGSGYEKVLMVLPERDNPVLTRELVYTGITRTELKFRLWAPKEVLKTALLRPTQRISGLVAALDNKEE